MCTWQTYFDDKCDEDLVSLTLSLDKKKWKNFNPFLNNTRTRWWWRNYTRHWEKKVVILIKRIVFTLLCTRSQRWRWRRTLRVNQIFLFYSFTWKIKVRLTFLFCIAYNISNSEKNIFMKRNYFLRVLNKELHIYFVWKLLRSTKT